MKTIVILACLLTLSGCVSNRMSITDLKSMNLSCENKAEQIRFLEKQMPTPDERMVMSMSFTADPEMRKAIMNREYEAQIRGMIWRLEQDCPGPEDNSRKCKPSRKYWGRPDLNAMPDCTIWVKPR